LEVERVVKGQCKVVGINTLEIEPISPYTILEEIRRFK
jgi:hypothetical protein